MVRAKFMVESVTKNAPYNGKQTATVRMRPVWNGSEENKRFWEATPGGTVELQMVNFAAVSQFEPGDEFFVDFTPALVTANE